MTAKELVDQINAASIYTPHSVEDEIGLNVVTEVATLDYDKRRWYVVATMVFQVGDEFFGVRGPIMLRSESMGYDDLEVKCTAFEMEQVPSVTYKRKALQAPQL